MGITPGRERKSCWKADRRIGYAIRKSNALVRDPIDIWSFDPVSGAAKRVGAKLVAHDEQNIGLHEGSALEKRPETVAAIAPSVNSVGQLPIARVRL